MFESSKADAIGQSQTFHCNWSVPRDKGYLVRTSEGLSSQHFQNIGKLQDIASSSISGQSMKLSQSLDAAPDDSGLVSFTLW